MPTRMFREGLLDSEPIHAAGELAENLFTRLMLVVDDYGRFDGRVAVICRRCWPIGGPNEADILERLVKLTQHGLVVAYEVDGKPFIYIPKFNQRLRQKTPKYPPPQTDVGRMPVTCPTLDERLPDICRPEVEVEVEVEEQQVRRRASRLPSDWEMPEHWKAWALKTQPSWTQGHLDKVAANFKDYWVAAPKGLKLDWLATWRKWVRNDGPMRGAITAASHSTNATSKVLTEMAEAKDKASPMPDHIRERFVHKAGSA